MCRWQSYLICSKTDGEGTNVRTATAWRCHVAHATWHKVFVPYGRHAETGNTLSGHKQAWGLLHLRTLIHVKRRSVTANCFFRAAAALWWPNLGVCRWGYE